MKTYLKSNNIIVFSLLLFLFTSCNNSETTTFYLVRHAEKEMNDSTKKQNDDPKLTKEGKQRAKKLAEVLNEEKISAIYSTAYQRNRKTVTPLAKPKDLSLSNYEWYDWQTMLDTINKNIKVTK